MADSSFKTPYPSGRLTLSGQDQGKKRQEKLGQTLRSEEETAAKRKARQLGLPYVNLDSTPINLEALGSVPEEKAKNANLAVIQTTGNKYHVALTNPENSDAQTILENLKEEKEVKQFIASESSLQKAWELYKRWQPEESSLEKTFLIEKKRWQKLQDQVPSVKHLKGVLKEFDKSADTTEVLNVLFVGARVGRATDIHLEPQEEQLRVRYRIDGVLEDVAFLSKERHHSLVSRIKILSELKLNLHNVHQDGRFTLRYEGLPKNQADVDIRVSVVPGSQGESIVMRLLQTGLKEAGMEKLGMLDGQLESLRAQMSQPNGMILTTGPTGSGKTTTLYSILKELQDPERNIITLEDPIEYQLQGITQTQVNKKKGYSFEKGLEAIVRQDPDIILVGEIRSDETADLSMNAALTGHLVLSTLHTNDAAGVVPRLQNLGVENSLLPSALNAAMAQRLVRKLCPHCKKQYNPSPGIAEAIEQALSLLSPKAGITPPETGKIYKPQGCQECFGTGYQGRTGIFEIFEINDVIEEEIKSGTTTYSMRKTAMEQGMVTMLQHGLLKLLDGTTSVEEIQRVAGDARYIETLYGQAVASLLSSHLEIEKELKQKLEQMDITPDTLSDLLQKQPLEKYLHAIMGAAFLNRATDVHLEPAEDKMEVRFRIDGVMHNFAELPKKYLPSVVSQVKKLSGLEIGTYSEVQEGRYSVIMQDTNFDIRVSVIPGGYGETVAMRLLDPDLGELTIENLGIREKDVNKLLKEVKKPQGMLLATGPTGHGKTTTLYSLMAQLDRKTKKIITIENPIEYRLEGLTQTQINPEKDYTYDVAVKSLLRQDPDVMMVGEIRDFDTAEAAIQASMTGHLLLSTVHTNDAPSAVDRLHNLGISYADISGGLNAILAQRLARRLCEACKDKQELSEQKKQKVKKALEDINETPKKIQTYTSEGCKECSGTGYKGRIGLFEIMYVDQDLRNVIADGAGYAEIKKAAQESGMRTLKQDGLLKAVQGETSLEELERVLGQLF